MNAFANRDDEELRFADETETDTLEQSWKILIVDDDAEVHTITQLALRDVVFDDKSLTFLSAYSAQEAQQLVQDHPDIAIIFLDVVMETDDAGLKLVEYIRETLGNLAVRIILRTGQPGQAPESMVAANYGIDDYKTKTELTAQKLTLSVLTALRAFSTLTTLLDFSQGLELDILQHQQATKELRQRESAAIAKVQQLEQSLAALQQSTHQGEALSKFDPLAQLVLEATQTTGNVPNPTDGLHTMSIVTRIARAVLRASDEHAAKLGISQTKLAVLMYLSSAPELCASPSELAKHCGVSRAAMTGLLDGLEQDAYVERDSHPSDRRALMIKLTPQGQEFLAWIAPQDQYRLSKLLETFDETERQKLNELAIRLAKLLEG